MRHGLVSDHNAFIPHVYPKCPYSCIFEELKNATDTTISVVTSELISLNLVHLFTKRNKSLDPRTQTQLACRNAEYTDVHFPPTPRH